jgi:hypothetical protein
MCCVNKRDGSNTKIEAAIESKYKDVYIKKTIIK